MTREDQSLLYGRTIVAHVGDQPSNFSLPEIIATLLSGRGDIGSFPNLAAEQRQHWYRFMVRCAVRALEGITGDTGSLRGADADALGKEIRGILEEATGGTRAWMLFHDDWGSPAFLQPPTPGGKPPEIEYKPRGVSLLTSTLGSKNHERKSDAVRSLDPEEALYALVEFQLGVIFGGRGNYESQLTGSRSGAGSGPPFMGARIGRGLSETFRHDVAVFRESMPSIRNELRVRGDVWALWTIPWDGSSQIGRADLHPAFVPMARQIRLGAPEDGVVRDVWFRPSSKSRVDDPTDTGNYGDPMMPLALNSAGAQKVRGVLSKGFDYREVADLLTSSNDKWASPSVRALGGTDGRADVAVLFEGLAFEQGKTVGFHRREVVLPTSGSRRGFLRLTEEAPDTVREVHRRMLEDVQIVGRVLRTAVRIYRHDDPKPRTGKLDDGGASIATRALEQRVNSAYLPRLFQAAEDEGAGKSSGAEWRSGWRSSLAKWGREAFEEALPAIPTAAASRFRRLSNADAYLRNALNKFQEAM